MKTIKGAWEAYMFYEEVRIIKRIKKKKMEEIKEKEDEAQA